MRFWFVLLLLECAFGAGAVQARALAPVPTVMVHSPPKGYSVVWNFGAPASFGAAGGGVVVDRNGNIFGTASGGAASADGAVFELQPAGNGYAPVVIHTFNGSDGMGTGFGSPLVDGNGNLWLTAPGGGASGNGTALELSPTAGGYAETALYSFMQAGGAQPYASLALDRGTFYVPVVGGGAYSKGAVVALSRPGLGARTVHSFAGSPDDGTAPVSNVVADADGTLYGTTAYGGSVDFDGGTVFRLTPSGHGFTESLLWSFGKGTDGAIGQAPPILDGAGNLYGTTQSGGTFGNGTVWRLSPGSGGYTETILYSFGAFADGRLPFSGLALVDGYLYGTTAGGGQNPYDASGTIFRISVTGSGYAILHNFSGGDGGGPSFGKWAVRGNSLYGTTNHGGAYGEGVVFRYVI